MAVEIEPGEGNSPAAWVAVLIMVVAIAAGTFAYWFDVPWLVWSCAGLVVVGALVGVILSKMGYGVKGPRYVPKAHS